MPTVEWTYIGLYSAENNLTNKLIKFHYNIKDGDSIHLIISDEKAITKTLQKYCKIENIGNGWNKGVMDVASVLSDADTLKTVDLTKTMAIGFLLESKDKQTPMLIDEISIEEYPINERKDLSSNQIIAITYGQPNTMENGTINYDEINKSTSSNWSIAVAPNKAYSYIAFKISDEGLNLESKKLKFYYKLNVGDELHAFVTDGNKVEKTFGDITSTKEENGWTIGTVDLNTANVSLDGIKAVGFLLGSKDMKSPIFIDNVTLEDYPINEKNDISSKSLMSLEGYSWGNILEIGKLSFNTDSKVSGQEWSLQVVTPRDYSYFALQISDSGINLKGKVLKFHFKVSAGNNLHAFVSNGNAPEKTFGVGVETDAGNGWKMGTVNLDNENLSSLDGIKSIGFLVETNQKSEPILIDKITLE